MKALILDKQAGTLALQVCRGLGRRGYDVDIFGTSNSMAFRSRYCAHALKTGTWNSDRVGRFLRRTIAAARYDAIYVCDEEILAILASAITSTPLRALPMPEMPMLMMLLSKHETLMHAAREGVPVPHTFIPADEAEAERTGKKMTPPFLVKGERGQSRRNVRVVTKREDLLPLYREIRHSEESYGGRPALQQMIRGQAYSVAGLFRNGNPLRICAHRKLLTFPPAGGITVMGVTESSKGLLEEALKAFAAFRYTGLGHAEFIRDEDDGQFKFIEINPRVWGSISIAEHADVDLYRPYQALASGQSVKPNLHFKEGVFYHRFSAEMELISKHPARLFGFVRDAIDPRVASDFMWSDPAPYLNSVAASFSAVLDRAFRYISQI